MLPETSIGQTKWIGPVKIVQILPHKLKIQFNNEKTRRIKQLTRLQPLDEFSKQEEGYAPKNEGNQDTISRPSTTNPMMSNPDPEQQHQNLLRTTRAKVRQLIQDHQTEYLIINALQTRQHQLIM